MHVRYIYKVKDYAGNIKKEVKIDEINDDSMGADFYEINKLDKDKLSSTAIMELDKIGKCLN